MKITENRKIDKATCTSVMEYFVVMVTAQVIFAWVTIANCLINL